MAQINIKIALAELDRELQKAGKKDVIYTLGGAALFLLGFDERATEDIDDLRDVMAGSIFECAKRVAKTLGIDPFWLNTGAAPVVKHFDKDWKQKCVLVYSGTNLKVYSVDRQTLINTKLAAACERSESDADDLKLLKATKGELAVAKKYVMRNYRNVPEAVIDGNIDWVIGG